MTPEDLERYVALADKPGLAAAVADLTEAERRKLSKTAQSLKRELEKARLEHAPFGEEGDALERLRPYLKGQSFNVWDQLQAADLAVLAVGPLSQAKKIRAHGEGAFRGDQENHTLKVLCDRRPEWIEQWLTAVLDDRAQLIDWDTLWGLIEAGVCRKPTCDGFYQTMVGWLTGWTLIKDDRTWTLTDLLASEPTLQEDVWKLFEVDTEAFTFDWGGGNDPHYESWPTAIFNLAQRGVIDRGRLLDATLSGQTTGFRLNILTGFARLHEQLEPTPDDLAARQATYSDLLSVPLPQVVSFSVKMLKKLDKAKRLDDAAFVASAGRVFDVTTKGPPKAVIAIIKKIVKRQPDLTRQAGQTLTDALNHPSEDVQGTAIDLLITWSDRLDAGTVREIAERLEDLPATVRPRAAELVRLAGVEVEATSAAEMELDADKRLAECRQRAAALAPDWRAVAGVDNALTVAEESSWASPLSFDPLQVPVLTGLDPVEPIQSLEELIDAVAHGIEQVDSAIELERVLDGMSRFCDQRTDDFDRRVAPLVRRVEKTKDSDNVRGIANQHSGPRELARTVGVWLTGNADLVKPKWGGGRHGGMSVPSFLNLRLETLRQRIADRKPAPLLALPTHQRGWIEPAALATRWHEIEQGGSRPARSEVVQALLRMAPDGRERALAATGVLTHRWSRALRWALGDDDGPEQNDVKDADVWLAAGRARSAFGHLPELAILGLQQTGADAVQPAEYGWQVRVEGNAYNDKSYWTPQISITAHPENKEKWGIQGGRPTILFHTKSSQWSPYGRHAPWVLDWISTVWPANLNAFFATGTECLVRRQNEPSSAWDPNYAFFPPLFDADRPWHNTARLMALVGLAGRDQDARGLAVDALVEAIADGRVHPGTLGSTLATLAVPNWLKLNRLCDNLAEVARVSPLHAWVVKGTLSDLLIACEGLPRDAHFLLSLLQELHAQLGLPPDADVAAKLQSVSGSSKTARLAKSLCSYAPEHPSAACQEIRLMTLEARLDRAERWAQRQ